MPSDQLLSYIEQARKSGVKDEQIRQDLIAAGWAVSDVETAMKRSEEKKTFFELHKYPIVTLIVILVVAGGYAALALYLNLWPLKDVLFSTPADDTSLPQKTYTPEELGFIITPPSDWKYEAIRLHEQDIQAAFRYESPDMKRSFLVAVFGNADPRKITLDEWAKQDAEKFDSQAKADASSKIGDLASRTYGGEMNGTVYKRAYVMRGVPQQIYRIAVGMDSNNSWMQDFDAIVSTFKFFEPKTEVNNIYKNLQFSFELTYPSTWEANEQLDGVRLRNYYDPAMDLPMYPLDVNIAYLKDKNPSQLAIQDWLQLGFNKDTIYVRGEKSRQPVDLGDEAIRVVRAPYHETSGISIITYLIKKGEDIIYATYSSRDNVQYVQNPDQVISSITFTP